WIRQQGGDLEELPIVIEARRHWRQLAGECGEDIGLREVGVTYLAGDAKALGRYADWIASARGHGLDTRLLDGREVAALIPGLGRRFAGGMVTPSDMKAEPWVAVPSLARQAAREGVRIVEGCAARRLEITAGRR